MTDETKPQNPSRQRGEKKRQIIMANEIPDDVKEKAAQVAAEHNLKNFSQPAVDMNSQPAVSNMEGDGGKALDTMREQKRQVELEAKQPDPKAPGE